MGIEVIDVQEEDGVCKNNFAENIIMALNVHFRYSMRDLIVQQGHESAYIFTFTLIQNVSAITQQNLSSNF